MLNIIFSRRHAPKGFVLDTKEYFRVMKKPEWFEHPLVKEFLWEIDGSEVLFQEALKNRWGYGISTEKISTGCKTLCSILFQDEPRYFYGSAMGNNCIPYLMKISSEYHDVNIFLEHHMMIPSKYFEQGMITVKGKLATEDDYDIAWEDHTDELMETGEDF